MHAAALQIATRTAEPDALDLLEQFGSTVKLTRDQELYPEGADATCYYRVVTGCIRTVKFMADGRRQVCEFLLPGDMLGLDDIRVHDFGAEAVADTVVRRYPRRMVEALAESHPGLARGLRDIMLAKLHANHQLLNMLGRKTACERIASFLLDMDKRINLVSRSFLELPMGRGDIADYLGLTVETVCRLLAHLKREQTLTIARTGVNLRDRAALRDHAG